MSVRRSFVALGLALFLVASVSETATAQDEPTSVVYASYFKCDLGMAERAGEILSDSWGPIAQAHIDSGDIIAWGSLSHHTGGEWSRAVYHVGTDEASLFSALDAMGAAWNEADPDGMAELWAACGEHEDYVWRYVTGSGPAGDLAVDRPAYGMSVYWTCDQSREALADFIFEHHSAELWNQQVEAGLIDSWSWMSHYLGDQYRRILVVDGASHANLLEARMNVIEAGSETPAIGAAFNDVCSSHVDYLWNIEAAGR